jgi:maltose O-acetyltransferase
MAKKRNFSVSQAIKITFSQMGASLWTFVSFLIPDWMIFAKVRSFLFSLFWKIGKNSQVQKQITLAYLGNFSAGSRLGMNRGNYFDNTGKISFGDNCIVGYRNLFITSSHPEKGKQKKDEVVYSRPITIGNNVWITSNCIILPGTRIENDVIISAGSVVKGTLESSWIYSGNPAVKIRKTEGAGLF